MKAHDVLIQRQNYEIERRNEEKRRSKAYWEEQ
jgi:hypothetical protein